jgi:hypothetical protein
MSSMFKIHSDYKFGSDSSQNFSEFHSIYTATLEANEIDPASLKPVGYPDVLFEDAEKQVIRDTDEDEVVPDLKSPDFSKNNARGILVIRSLTTGDALIHIQSYKYAADMLLVLKRIYGTMNSITSKIAKDEFLNTQFEENAYLYKTNLLQNWQKYNSGLPATRENAKLSYMDLQYQFLEGLLESIHNPLAVAWLQDLHTGKEIPSLDAMVEALALSSASTEAKTKRAMNLRPAAPSTAPTGGKKQIPRARPCQFCQGPHWDKDCSDAPACYKIAGHRPRECADCATRYKEKRAKESAEA